MAWGAAIAKAADTAVKFYQHQNDVHNANVASKVAYERAKEFAQNQIQWRVQDAKKAGIHPVYALGANVSMGAPSVIPPPTSSELDLGLGELGQNIAGAIDRGQDKEDREAEMKKQEELYDLDIAIKKQQIAESNARIREHDARTNQILNPVKVQNYVRGASFMHGAQPRVPARPRVSSNRSHSVTDGANVAPISKSSVDNLMAYQKGPNGEWVLVPSKTTAETGQNMWGLLEAYGYGSWLYNRLKHYAGKAGAHARKSGYFERALNQW